MHCACQRHSGACSAKLQTGQTHPAPRFPVCLCHTQVNKDELQELHEVLRAVAAAEGYGDAVSFLSGHLYRYDSILRLARDTHRTRTLMLYRYLVSAFFKRMHSLSHLK